MDASALAFVGEALSPPGSALGVLAVSPSSLKRLTGARAASAAALIDALGRSSASAQGLATPITSAVRFSSPAAETESQLLYVVCSGRTALGFCKTGRRALFIPGARGWKEVSALCVLDIFVDAPARRQGIGRVLFDAVLAHEAARAAAPAAAAPAARPGRSTSTAAAPASSCPPGYRLHPCSLAYDRPSIMLLGFLRKHYGLEAAAAASVHNFVMFAGFGEPVPLLEPVGASSSAEHGSGADAAGGRSAYDGSAGAAVATTAKTTVSAAYYEPGPGASAVGPARGGAGAFPGADASSGWAGTGTGYATRAPASAGPGPAAFRSTAVVSGAAATSGPGFSRAGESRSVGSSWGARAAPFATSFDAEPGAADAAGPVRYAGRPHVPAVPSRTQGY